MEKVERRKGSEEARLEHQHQAEKQARLMVNAMRRIHRHQRDNGREHQHESTQAIDAQVIFDAKRRRPGYALNHAHRSIGR